MSAHLSSDNEAFIAQVRARGDYRDRDQVLDAGITLLRRREKLLAIIDEGQRQLDEGEYVELDVQGLEALKDRLKARARAAAPGQ